MEWLGFTAGHPFDVVDSSEALKLHSEAFSGRNAGQGKLNRFAREHRVRCGLRLSEREPGKFLKRLRVRDLLKPGAPADDSKRNREVGSAHTWRQCISLDSERAAVWATRATFQEGNELQPIRCDQFAQRASTALLRGT